MFRAAHLGSRTRLVLLNIHGGGWVIGNKGTQAMPLLMHMASHGWLVVDADYRLSPSARMPDHIVDVKRAIAWTGASTPPTTVATRAIVITGGSAGGHLVAPRWRLTANQREWQPGFEACRHARAGAVPLRQVRPARRVQAGRPLRRPT